MSNPTDNLLFDPTCLVSVKDVATADRMLGEAKAHVATLGDEEARRMLAVSVVALYDRNMALASIVDASGMEVTVAGAAKSSFH